MGVVSAMELRVESCELASPSASTVTAILHPLTILDDHARDCHGLGLHAAGRVPHRPGQTVRPYHPPAMGQDERLHASPKAETLSGPPFQKLKVAAAKLSHWRMADCCPQSIARVAFSKGNARCSRCNSCPPDSRDPCVRCAPFMADRRKTGRADAQINPCERKLK